MLPDFAAEGTRCLPAAACPRFQAKLTTFGLAGGIGYLRAISAEQLQRKNPSRNPGPLIGFLYFIQGVCLPFWTW